MTYKSKKELAAAYRISSVTLRKMLKQIPEIKANNTAKIISPDDLKVIFLRFGNPFEVPETK